MTTNGRRILSLGEARSPSRKGSDFITRDQCNALIVEECTKVHEWYLNQLPPYVARMIQDALMSYGLIKLSDEAQLAATETTPADPPPADPA